MRNPWRMQDGPDNKINRNNFPMSFQYNGTFKYGKIYPIGLIRTIPGASYQIDSTLALNFMPTSFPIQTRQRAYVHFFYGRDRNFWKDYKDFVNGMNPDLVKPYLDESVTQARTGSLLDYLGVPTTLVGKYGLPASETINLEFNRQLSTSTASSLSDLGRSPWLFTNGDTYGLMRPASYGKGNTLVINSLNSDSLNVTNPLIAFDSYTYDIDVSKVLETKQIGINIAANGTLSYNSQIYTSLDEFLSITPPSTFNSLNYVSPSPKSDNSILGCICCYLVDSSNKVLTRAFAKRNQGNGKLIFEFNPNDDISTASKLIIFIPVGLHGGYSSKSVGDSGFSIESNYNTFFYSTDNYIYPYQLVYYYNQAGVIDIDDSTSPYWRSGATTDLRSRIKLNAIPCRMYETIYNLYYRNPQNNPYILNGKPEYNVFIPTKDGGADSNLYELRYRNWEDDFLTTAVQTPQQGIAPLVGLTDRGATVTLTNEDGSVTRYKTNLDENGNVTGIETTDSSEPLLTQALIDAVSYGISIEDLRNVNAMQKWLELNLRKGYQYKDIIEARWGISISYNELDLPEFIGGFTQEVGLQAVTQTTSHGEGIEGALGWQAGRMYAAGEGRSITHYCEEEGYIMALLTVVPVPNYSQLLPKHWFTRDLLDSYQPEFNHIGFQPITYKEVCPIQAYQESTENVDVLEQTFGYQRPWYEYFNQVDEVHGQFRTTFKDFLINRTFDVKPELSESFLLVDPNQVNDVFAVTTDDDKILGAINHRIVAKLPISLYAQARLE